MLHCVETGCDGATVCFFDPAALPPDFDEKLPGGPVELMEALEREGRFWSRPTGADGAFLFHFYVEEDPPERILQYCQEPVSIPRFQVPSGVIWSCGTEYACREPQRGSPFTPKGGLGRFSHMGGKIELPRGAYAMTAWRTEWPDGVQERRMTEVLGPTWRRMNALGTSMGCLLLGLVIGTVVAIVSTLTGSARTRLGVGGTWGVWGLLIVLWGVCVAMMRTLSRWERNPAKKAVDLEFPSIVVKLHRLSDGLAS